MENRTDWWVAAPLCVTLAAILAYFLHYSRKEEARGAGGDQAAPTGALRLAAAVFGYVCGAWVVVVPAEVGFAYGVVGGALYGAGIAVALCLVAWLGAARRASLRELCAARFGHVGAKAATATTLAGLVGLVCGEGAVVARFACTGGPAFGHAFSLLLGGSLAVLGARRARGVGLSRGWPGQRVLALVVLGVVAAACARAWGRAGAGPTLWHGSEGGSGALVVALSMCVASASDGAHWARLAATPRAAQRRAFAGAGFAAGTVVALLASGGACVAAAIAGGLVYTDPDFGLLALAEQYYVALPLMVVFSASSLIDACTALALICGEAVGGRRPGEGADTAPTTALPTVRGGGPTDTVDTSPRDSVPRDAAWEVTRGEVPLDAPTRQWPGTLLYACLAAPALLLGVFWQGPVVTLFVMANILQAIIVPVILVSCGRFGDEDGKADVATLHKRGPTAPPGVTTLDALAEIDLNDYLDDVDEDAVAASKTQLRRNERTCAAALATGAAAALALCAAAPVLGSPLDLAAPNALLVFVVPIATVSMVLYLRGF